MIGLLNLYRNKNKIEQLYNFLSKIAPVKIVNTGYQFKNIDCFLLSGSERLITENEYEIKWLEFIRNVDLPLLGICYGFQLVSIAFGGIMEKRKELKRNVRISRLTDDPLLAGLPENPLLPESHREFVTALSDELIPLMTYNNSFEALKHRYKIIYGTQFHFERSKEYGKLILENFLNLI